MHLQAHTRHEFEKLLFEDGRVRSFAREQLRNRRSERSRSGMPPDLRNAMRENPEIRRVVRILKDLRRYHSQVVSVAARRVRGKTVSLKSELALVRAGVIAEEKFHELVALTTKLSKWNPAADAYGPAIASYPHETAVFANPAFLDRDETRLLRYLGVDYQIAVGSYENLYLPRREQVQLLLADKKLRGRYMSQVGKVASRIPFAESPRNLVVQGVITFGGSGWWEALGAAIVSAVAVVVSCVVPAAAPYLVPVAIGAATTAVHEVAEAVGILEEDNEITISANYDLDVWKSKKTEKDAALPFLASDSNNRALSTTLPVGGVGPFSGTGKRVTSLAGGEYIANTSYRKKEVHRRSCSFLHLTNPANLRVYDSLRQAHSAGMDNCHYCIGGSKR